MAYNYILSPKCGYLVDFSDGARPGTVSSSEKGYLRELANTVAEIAALSVQDEKRRVWYDHCSLKSKKPLLLVFPESSWAEILPKEILKVNDPYWRQWEWYLRHLIYRHKSLCDDLVIDPVLYINRRRAMTGWGLDTTVNTPEHSFGAFAWNPPIQNPDDIKKLKRPELIPTEDIEREEYSATQELFGDILQVEYYGQLPAANYISEACFLRGTEQLMVDMYDRPEWVHELMGFISGAFIDITKQLEQANNLTLNNSGHYTDSGGISYTHELPSEDFDGEHVRLKDLWGFGLAQEFVHVSPEQHEEFLLNYQMPILEQCGLVSYGCCEPYTRKFEMLKRLIPNLRRVSVSPWCDIDAAVRELEDKYIISWKPNPAMLAGEFRPECVRNEIRSALERMSGCVVEIVLKDLSSIDNDKAKLESWVGIVREEIDRITS